MAQSTKTSHEKEHKDIPLTSYQTALAIVPPRHLRERVDRLRKNYDKSYTTWPAHLNIIYPFVSPERLSEAVEMIRSLLAESWSSSSSTNLHLSLGKPGHFSHRRSNTVFATVADDHVQNLRALRNRVVDPFKKVDEEFNPHLTVGRTGIQWQMREFLLQKVGRMLPIDWSVDELVVLVREEKQSHTAKKGVSPMNIWGTIRLDGSSTSRTDQLTDGSWKGPESGTISRENAYQFSPAESIWKQISLDPSDSDEAEHSPSQFTISSYNVLLENYYPARTERFEPLCRAILSDDALADALVLQEVSDELLSYLLGVDEIRYRYPFTTHGPPDQSGIDPLMSLRNVVVLSRWKFTWDWLPFKEQHKGSPIIYFANIGLWREGAFRPLTLTGVHLSSGLTDEAVSARESQVATILNHLSKEAPSNPWIIAGDFNVVTSEHTISLALRQVKSRKITAESLSTPERLLSNASFHDSWARTQRGDEESSLEDTYKGEQGATFDPILNQQATRTSGPDLYQRPQRFDRIFAKKDDYMACSAFNLFGFPDRRRHTELQYASDHWGVRASLSFFSETTSRKQNESSDQVYSHMQRSDERLTDSTDGAQMKAILPHNLCPTEREREQRENTFSGLKRTLQVALSGLENNIEEDSRSHLVVVPVGSYGLDVWMSSSDIDCMCISSISPRLFFSPIIDRLTTNHEGLRSIRRVDAATGTMLRLDIDGFKFDVQYCQAPHFVHIWPEGLNMPPTDPIFNLPMQALSKLKPLRDLRYLERTIPDMDSYRYAHRFIVTWAKARGIYSSKFGYLGGFHVSMLLARTFKLLTSNQEDRVSATDLIRAFFSDYSRFDWKNNIIYDPEFHEQPPKYRREEREPVVILGPHVPNINVARTASVSSVRTLEEELQQADQLLSKKGADWRELIGQTNGEKSESRSSSQVSVFLTSYPTYIRMDVQYWDNDSSAAGSLIGWIESRCVHLIVDITRKLPMLHARIWPSRFTSSSHGVNRNDASSEHQTSYLIGLRKLPSAPTEEIDRKIAHDKLLAILSSFVDSIRADPKYFDPSSAWVDAKLVKQAAIRSLAEEQGEWEDVIRQSTA